MNKEPTVRSQRSRCIGRKLAAYVAASTSMAAAETSAAIIHTDLRSHPASFVGEGEFNVDLNGDDTSDFQFVREIKQQTIRRNCTSSSGWSWCQTNGRRFSDSIVLRGLNNNGLVADGRGLALKLPKGMVISQAAHEEALLLKFTSFTEHNTYGNSSGSHWTGNFQGEVVIHTSYGTTVSSEMLPSRGFLGMTFSIDGSMPQAAWADIEILATPAGSVSAIRMYGFAYESEAGKPILAGDTGPAVTFPGDTNGDGAVDIEDLNNVRNNFGSTGDGVLGDSNGDDEVNIEDLNAVRKNFGAVSPVPEPPSLVLLAAGAAGLAVLRRRRAKHEQDDVTAAG